MISPEDEINITKLVKARMLKENTEASRFTDRDLLEILTTPIENYKWTTKPETITYYYLTIGKRTFDVRYEPSIDSYVIAEIGEGGKELMRITKGFLNHMVRMGGVIDV